MSPGIVENNPSVVGSIAAWQSILNGCGYNPPLIITGLMDNETVTTSKKFQKDLALSVTGTVTLPTWKAGLDHAKEKGWSPVTPPIFIDQILQLAPKPTANYLAAFTNTQATLTRYEISNTPLRVAHFIAQVMHECGGLTIEFENLNYSATRLPQVWPGRFEPTGLLDPKEFAGKPQKLANEVYGGRMGNTDSEDGYKYRGRGLLQLTGKYSYKDATRILRKTNPLAPDFVVDPDEVVSAAWCLEIAASEWKEKGCNALADNDDIDAITKKINGGLIGLPARKARAKKTKIIWL